MKLCSSGDCCRCCELGQATCQPQEGVRGSWKGNEERLLPRKWPQALGEPGEEQSCRDKGSRVWWDGQRQPGDPTKWHEPVPGHCPAASAAAW